MDIFIIAVSAIVVIAAVVYIAIKHSFSNGEVPKLPYRLKRYFFTRSEWEFFRTLEQLIDKDRYAVFPKVRLGDFIEVDLPKGERMPYWNRIRSRHVDFLLWDIKNGAIVAAIEVDGNSHNSPKSQETDDFKDRLYRSINLPLYRVRVGSDFKSEIAHMLDQTEGKEIEK